MVIRRRAPIAQDAEVKRVCRQEQVEIPEIVRANLTRSKAREVVAAPVGMEDTTGIGRIADVVILRPSGVQV